MMTANTRQKQIVYSFSPARHIIETVTLGNHVHWCWQQKLMAEEITQNNAKKPKVQ